MAVDVVGHGLAVTLPGGHQCEVQTFTDGDADAIRDMLRHTGCRVVDGLSLIHI